MNPCGYLHISDNGASVRAQGLSPLKPQRGRMDSKSYALLAQWLNGMSFAVNSYLIPIQLCGGKKTKCHRYNVSMAFLSFSLVLMHFLSLQLQNPRVLCNP